MNLEKIYSSINKKIFEEVEIVLDKIIYLSYNTNEQIFICLKEVLWKSLF